MEFSIEHEIPGRLRLRCPEGSFTRKEAAVMGVVLETQPGILKASASHRTWGILIHYDGDRDSVLNAARLLGKDIYGGVEPEISGVPGLGESIASMLCGALIRRLLPWPARRLIALLKAVPFILQGIGSLFKGRKLNVSVLDASAIGVSILRGDFTSVSTITTLLALGDMFEEWTRKKSKESLIQSLSLDFDRLWVLRGGSEIQIPASEVAIGDLAVIRSGSIIPVDGTIAEGEAMINQSSMTGESEPVRRTPGQTVYAGTVIEDGTLVIRVTAFDSETRIHKIADMIDESEKLKAEVQTYAEKISDAIVPYSFLLAGAVYALTRSPARAAAALMVDYSCAIKLSSPLAVLSAMWEAARRGILVKGGKFLEALASAETVVFDKTGTLTVSAPSVADVIPFEGYSRDGILTLAACLEEHFPHSVARAVVRQAEHEGLHHPERHTEVEYVVAHGIKAFLDNDAVLIGSEHFVLGDEGVFASPEQLRVAEEAAKRRSVLYLAIDSKLAGLICIEDALRQDARRVVGELRNAGISRVAILTGDNRRTAENIASELGVTEVYSQLLPEDKSKVVKSLRQYGKVVMVGDGINDAPALSASDAGIAMHSGADIANEVADIVLTENRLNSLIDARRLGAGLMSKIRKSYSIIIGSNSILLALGLSGALSPSAAALLHNLVTVGVSAYSMTPILGPTVDANK